MSEGPYLTAAFFCERVIEDKEKVLTIVRIMDSVVVYLPPGTPNDFPSEENRLPVHFDNVHRIACKRAMRDSVDGCVEKMRINDSPVNGWMMNM